MRPAEVLVVLGILAGLGCWLLPVVAAAAHEQHGHDGPQAWLYHFGPVVAAVGLFLPYLGAWALVNHAIWRRRQYAVTTERVLTLGFKLEAVIESAQIEAVRVEGRCLVVRAPGRELRFESIDDALAAESALFALGRS